MNSHPLRRNFLAQSLGVTACAGIAAASGEIRRRSGTSVRVGLNAYSFNRPLMAGKMTLAEVIDYCAEHNIEGTDLTGYYFPGYPNAPSDEYLYSLKRTAFLNGVT